MEETQKAILISILNINLKLTNKDATCVSDINNLILNTTIDSEKSFVNNNLGDRLLALAEENFSFVESVISNCNLVNKEYLSVKIKAVNAMRNKTQYNLKDFVTTALNTVYTVITPAERFGLYQILVKLAIMEGSSELIQLTISKIQLL